MDITHSWKVLLFLAISFFGVSTAKKYNVGDKDGWRAGIQDYNQWAYDNKFRVGDVLVFKYDSQYHNVMEVNQQDYESCNSSSPILTYTTGHDSVELTSCGHHYYICGTPGHCEAGQKADILVKDPNGQQDICSTFSPPNVSPPSHNVAPSSKIPPRLFATMLGILGVVVYTTF